jgi:hypothetical protein
MEIVRLENGNVELRDGGVFVWSIPQLPTEIKPIDKDIRDHVKLFQSDGRVEYLHLDEITETQVLPDPAVPFSGDVFDLAALMSSDFFFEVVGGAGSIDYIEDVSLVGGSLDFTGVGLAFSGSVPLTGLGDNIYNADGALTGDREVDIDGNELSFTNFQLFEISSGVNLEIQSQQAAIEIDEDLEVSTQDTTLNSDNLDIITDIFRLNIPSADAVGKVLAVANSTSKEVEFVSASSLVSSNTIFSEQDQTTTSTGALWSTRHTFTGNLDVGTYQIDFFTYMGAGGAFAELQNGIRVNTVLEYARGFSTFFVVEQAYPNTYLLEVTTAGPFTIEGQFIRITAGITVDCNFSNMIIKKL